MPSCPTKVWTKNITRQFVESIFIKTLCVYFFPLNQSVAEFANFCVYVDDRYVFLHQSAASGKQQKHDNTCDWSVVGGEDESD